MKLIYLNTVLDSTVEHELESSNEFGFNVTVTYTKDSWMSVAKGKQESEIFHNCTEVHHMYDTIIRKDELKIAFESDFHSTGCNRYVQEIESVVIELATKIEDKF